MEWQGFISKAREAFPFITEGQEGQFRTLEGLYSEWNSKINVISRKDIGNLYEKHVLHSLAIARYLALRRSDIFDEWRQGGVSVLDLGTGGGFPGIPLAILFPGVRFTLCDSIGKKITVAKEIASATGLSNAVAINSRAEALPGQFDFVVSRAVAPLSELYPWVRGRFTRDLLCLKGGDVGEEIAEFAAKCRVRQSAVRTWEVDSWLEGENFASKFVVDVERG